MTMPSCGTTSARSSWKRSYTRCGSRLSPSCRAAWSKSSASSALRTRSLSFTGARYFGREGRDAPTGVYFGSFVSRLDSEVRRDRLQVADEGRELGLAVVGPENRRRVHRRDDDWGQVGGNRVAAVLRDAKVAAEQRLRGGRAEGDENARLHDRELGVQPRATRGDLGPVRLLVDAPLPARLPLEVLDDVRDVRERAVDAGLLERPVEQLPGRADERFAGLVLLIAGLLADEHRLRFRQSFAEDGLRPGLPEVARLASGSSVAERLQREPVGDERRCGVVEQALLRHLRFEATRRAGIPCVHPARWPRG